MGAWHPQVIGVEAEDAKNDLSKRGLNGVSMRVPTRISNGLREIDLT